MRSMKINCRIVKRFLQTCHFLGRIKTKLISEEDQHGLSVIRLRRVNRLVTCLFYNPCPTGNAWWSNTLKHCLVTKLADVVLSGQMVSNMFDHRPNEQNVLSKSLSTFKFYQTRSNKVSKRENVLSPNISRLDILRADRLCNTIRRIKCLTGRD